MAESKRTQSGISPASSETPRPQTRYVNPSSSASATPAAPDLLSSLDGSFNDSSLANGKMPRQASLHGILPSLGIDLLVDFVKAFDYSSLDGVVGPMRHITQSLAQFQPMSLWGGKEIFVASSNTGHGLQGLELWMSQCAMSSPKLRSSAIVALQKLALASGKLSSLLRIATTAHVLEGSSMNLDDCSSSKNFINYLHTRVEDSARDTLLLSSVDKWECEICTYLNEPASLICHMCTSPREVGESFIKAKASLRTRTGTSMQAPRDPISVVGFASLFEALLAELEQLCRYRLSSSVSGPAVLAEPYLVEVDPSTFKLIRHLLASLAKNIGVEIPQDNFDDSFQGTSTQDSAIEIAIDETEVNADADKKDGDYFKRCMLSTLLILKLNIRRKQAFTMQLHNILGQSAGSPSRDVPGSVDDVAQKLRQDVTSSDLESIQSILTIISESKILDPNSRLFDELGAVRLELALAGGPKMIVQFMKESTHLISVQASGCRALCQHVVMAGDGGKSCSDDGGLEATVSAIQTCSMNLEVLLPGLRLLSNMVTGSALERLGLSAVSDLTIGCMEFHISNVEIQLSGMRILNNIAKLGDAERKLLDAESVRRGSKVQKLSQSVFTSNAKKTANAHNALQSNPIAGQKFQTVLVEIAPKIFPIVTRVLHEHAHEKELLREGCILLSLVSNIEAEMVGILVRNNGISTVSLIITASEHDVKIQQLAMRLLCQLLTHPEPGVHYVQPQLLMRVLRTFPDSIEIAEGVLPLLADKIDVTSFRNELFQNGGVRALTDTVACFGGQSSHIAVNGANLLYGGIINGSDEEIKAFSIDSMRTCFINTFDQYKASHPSIGKCLVAGFCKLLSTQSIAHQHASLANLVTAKRIIEIMKAHEDDAHILCDSIWCLEYVSDVQRSSVASNGGFKEIVKAMKR